MQGSLFPWGRIPNEYTWAAVDKNGWAYAFWEHPTLDLDGGCWESDAGILEIGIFSAFLYHPWTDSLERRPQ
jgi:hypothetical protein